MMQGGFNVPPTRQSRQSPQPLGKHARFSGSSEHWRDWREPKTEDPWRGPIPPEAGVVSLPPPPPAKPAQAPVPSPSTEPNRPTLVPMDAPWTDGRRYREAGACERPGKLDLYVEDPAGPWIRRHGVLIATFPPAQLPNCAI